MRAPPARVREAQRKQNAWIYWKYKPEADPRWVEADKYVEWWVTRDPDHEPPEGWELWMAPFWIESPELWEAMSEQQRKAIVG